MPIYALGDAEPTIPDDVFVHPEAVIIGSVVIGSGSSIWPCAVIRGDEATIHIGNDTSVQDGAVLHTTAHAQTRVGNGVVIGHLAHLEGCIVEDNALIGSNSVVLHRAIIRTGALVGASAVVSGGVEVPSGAMALGVPAQIKTDRVDPEHIRVNAAVYVQRGRDYRERLRRIG